MVERRKHVDGECDDDTKVIEILDGGMYDNSGGGSGNHPDLSSTMRRPDHTNASCSFPVIDDLNATATAIAAHDCKHSIVLKQRL